MWNGSNISRIFICIKKNLYTKYSGRKKKRNNFEIKRWKISSYFRGINLKPFFIITILNFKISIHSDRRVRHFPKTKRNKYLLITNLSARYLTNFHSRREYSYSFVSLFPLQRIFFTPIRKPYCRTSSAEEIFGSGFRLWQGTRINLHFDGANFILKRPSSAPLPVLRYNPLWSLDILRDIAMTGINPSICCM